MIGIPPDRFAQMRPSVDEFLLGWGTVGDIADEGVLVGVVM